MVTELSLFFLRSMQLEKRDTDAEETAQHFLELCVIANDTESTTEALCRVLVSHLAWVLLKE